MSPPSAQDAVSASSDEDLWYTCRQLDKIAYSASYTHVTGNVAAGVLLSQILYWFRRDKSGKTKVGIKKNGQLWLSKTRSEWHVETGLSPSQVKRALARLRQLGLIKTARHLFAGKVTVHILLNEGATLAALRASAASTQCAQ